MVQYLKNYKITMVVFNSMKKINFPEKFFETLINHELLMRGFDIFVPSQVDEAQKGYDALFQNGKVKVGFFQYKIVSKYKINPKGHKDSPIAFKFKLHKSKQNIYKQHNQLVKLYKKGEKSGYVVPCFETYRELYDFYHNSSLLNKTYIIMSKYIINDTKNHYITFDEKKAFQHSNQSCKLEVEPLEAFINSIKDSQKEYDKESLAEELLFDYDENEINVELDAEKNVIKMLYRNNLIMLTYRGNSK